MNTLNFVSSSNELISLNGKKYQVMPVDIQKKIIPNGLTSVNIIDLFTGLNIPSDFNIFKGSFYVTDAQTNGKLFLYAVEDTTNYAVVDIVANQEKFINNVFSKSFGTPNFGTSHFILNLSGYMLKEIILPTPSS